ncbi:hypothetical protein CDL15_Pgr023766 [Punica granatum]|uniref:Uncharacterized protein n=1 Tax=Punica granatum TaxID=22663 RepID=A0A218WR15_PUNGR|nr:hypothetical protein CDL15_Pgr023766 [Punica granatum]PKI64087.1 hypothetical protein CRG98_015531 [Punica granatum]
MGHGQQLREVQWEHSGEGRGPEAAQRRRGVEEDVATVTSSGSSRKQLKGTTHQRGVRRDTGGSSLRARTCNKTPDLQRSRGL